MKYLMTALIFFCLNNVYAEGKKVYQYSNDSGVPEFTDRQQRDKSLDKKFKIKAGTEKQKQEGEARLKEIQTYNKDFDKRYYAEKQREQDAINFQIRDANYRAKQVAEQEEQMKEECYMNIQCQGRFKKELDQ